MKDINITFVNYFTRDDILKAVGSVISDISDCEYDAQITVVDNSQNKDGLKELLAEKFPGVRYIGTKENIGFGKGNTLGFQSAPARYYFALNRDVLFPKNSQIIERIIKYMDSHPKIGCIGPKLVNLDGSTQYACYRFDFFSIFVKPFRHIYWDKKYKKIKKYTDKLLMKDFDHQKTMPVDWILGAAMVVRREVVDDIGWFDGRYFMYFEDCDWCRAMWERGWPVYYVHDIVIKHAHARDSARVPGVITALLKNKLARVHLKSWIKYLWKWRGRHNYFKN